MLSYDAGPPGIEDLKPVDIKWTYYLYGWLPFSIPCFQREQKLIEHSEKMLDIVELVKKVKVATRNLKVTQKLRSFEPKKLVEGGQEVQEYKEIEYNSKF